MSGRDYLRNKMATTPQTINVRKPTDASMITQKKRFTASAQFLVSGGKGALRSASDGGNFMNTIVGSSFKLTGVGADASVFTAYKGGQAISDDAPFRAGGFKSPPCFPTSVTISNFNNSSSRTSLLRNCPVNTGDMERPSVFVDNTIKLNSGVASLLRGCPTPATSLTAAYHGPKNIACFYRPYTDFTRNTSKPWIGRPIVLPVNLGSYKVGGATPWTKFNTTNATSTHHGNAILGHKYPYSGRFLNADSYNNYTAMKINRPTLFNIKG